jgi:A/G-specific adenine glycosylase
MNFSHQLIAWYHKSKRDLPWRRTKDPYLIWLSEIILQQTRIDQGLPYYEKFVSAYPTVELMAKADEQDILKLWQGLGYYSRARNLHEASRMIVQQFNGTFPNTYDGIRSLKGVGDYTAAAVASIVFGLPCPVVDGNVIRFISRYFGITESTDLSITKKRILETAREHLDHNHPGDFNQAMMEFGATQCTPVNPSCSSCVFHKACFAFKQGMVAALPARSQKTKVRSRYIHYLVVTCTIGGEDFIYMNKRTGNDIWKNMFDFPQFELTEGIKQDHPLNVVDLKNFLQADQSGLTITQFQGVSSKYDHLLTHQRLQAWFYRFHSEQKIKWPHLLVPMKRVHDYPVPRLVDRYLKDFLYLCV